MSELILEVSHGHGLERFYELDLCQRAHTLYYTWLKSKIAHNSRVQLYTLLVSLDFYCKV